MNNEFNKNIFEKLLELLNISGFTLCVVNTKGQIQWANEYFKNLFNTSGDYFHKLVEGKDTFETSILYSLIFGELKSNEILFSPINSKWFTLNKIKFTLDEDHYLILLEDITERKSTFENYISSLTILDNVEDGIYSTDFENRVTYWNKGAEKIYGYTEKEILGKIINKDFKLYDEFNEDVLYQIAQDLEKYRTYSLKRREYRKDYSEIWIEGSVTLVSDLSDKPTGFLYIVRDVTSKLTSEILNHLNANLQKSLREITANILNDFSLSELSFQVTKKCKDLTESEICSIFKVNEKQSEIIELISDFELNENVKSELKETAFLIKKWLQLNKLPYSSWEEDNSEIKEKLTSLLKLKNYIISPVIIKDDVDYFILSGFNDDFLLKFKVDVNNSFSSFLSFIISYFEKKILQESLEDKLRNAQKFELTSKLVSGIVHDFKNILNGIHLLVESIKTKKNDEFLEKWLQDLENLVNRGIDLSKSLLSVGKPLKPHKTEFALNKLLKEIQSILQNTCPKNIKIAFNLLEQSPLIYADYSQLHQVLMNLALNAIDAMPNGGELTIKTEIIEVSEKDFLSNTKIKPGNYVKITISDTGVGIPQENIAKIFEPYFSTKSTSTGTGLGLFISKNIVMNHSGFIDVESELGKGTTFIISLPYLPKLTSKPEIKVTHLLRKEKPTILLVDDEDTIRSLLSEMLSYNNFEIIQASSGDEAISIIEERLNQIDLAIVDYFLKDNTGLEILRKIKQIKEDLPVFIATGLIDDDMVKKLNEFKVDKIIEKPYEFDELLESINNFIHY